MAPRAHRMRRWRANVGLARQLPPWIPSSASRTWVIRLRIGKSRFVSIVPDLGNLAGHLTPRPRGRGVFFRATSVAGSDIPPRRAARTGGSLHLSCPAGGSRRLRIVSSRPRPHPGRRTGSPAPAGARAAARGRHASRSVNRSAGQRTRPGTSGQTGDGTSCEITALRPQAASGPPRRHGAARPLRPCQGIIARAPTPRDARSRCRCAAAGKATGRPTARPDRVRNIARPRLAHGPDRHGAGPGARTRRYRDLHAYPAGRDVLLIALSGLAQPALKTENDVLKRDSDRKPETKEALLSE